MTIKLKNNMYNIKSKIFGAWIFLALFAISCEKAYDPYPTFETVPHSFGKFKAATPTSLNFGNNNSKLEGDLLWISTDGKVKVTESDLYITWTESYKDKDGLPKTANHGKRKLKNSTDVGAAREAKPWSFTAVDIYNLFKDAKFDYKDDKGVVAVFDAPKDGDRSASSRFTSNDKFVLSWAFKGDDGRYFDSWSGGICSETVGSNCSLTFGVICTSAIEGTYKAVAVGKSTDSCCPDLTTVESTVTIKALGSGKYEISDFSGGLYQKWYEVYGIDAAYAAVTDKTKNKLIGDITDACNKVSGSWAEPFQDATLPFMIISGQSIPAEGKIVYKWTNGYDDFGDVTLTKQ
jgi:hypothetical protein